MLKVKFFYLSLGKENLSVPLKNLLFYQKGHKKKTKISS